MPKRIAIFGGSFNPPGKHHAAIAVRLAQEFDEIRVIPCGPRPDKPETDNSVPSVYRAALADIVFGGLPGVTVDLSDFEQETFTRNHELQRRFAAEGELWHVVGADLVVGGARGESLIQRVWARGVELWQQVNFAVLHRPGYPLPEDLPPRSRVIELQVEGSSTAIREHLSHGKCVRDLVPPRAEAYLARYGLYRAPVPGHWARGTLEAARFFLQEDAANPKARELTALLDGKHVPADKADFINVIGGDGAMLRCIREHWRQRLPFFGINAGHLGFLLNAPEQVTAHSFPPTDVIFRQMPMLFLEFEDEEGRRHPAHGFNDSWLERATSQSAWLEITVNHVRRIPKLVCDGALVATAAGSTAYARSMGAPPLLADTPAWLLVGSNVLQPGHWRSALLSPDTTVEIRNIEPKRRPVQAYVDGLSMGRVVALHARLSRAAAAELVFCASHDMAEKIAAIQFGA